MGSEIELTVMLCIVVVVFILFLFFVLKSSQDESGNSTYRVEETKDRAAKPIYATISFLSDKIVINNKEFIINENLVRAYVDSQEVDVRLVGSLVSGGPRYKRGTIYRLVIQYKSTDPYRDEDSKSFGSLSLSENNKYLEVAKRINAITGYIAPPKETGLREL